MNLLMDTAIRLFFLASISLSMAPESAHAQSPPPSATLIKDLTPGPESSTIGSLVPLNGFVLFLRDGTSPASALWRTDGTEIGTVQFATIQTFSPAIVIGNELLFVGTDGLVGEELWRTDGTNVVLVKDISSGPFDSNPHSFTRCGSNVFFVATDRIHGTELWKTDGTSNGTSLVADIVEGYGSSAPEYLVAFDGLLYFGANDGPTERLWKTDGTLAGTVLAGPNLSSLRAWPEVAAGTNLFFSACDATRCTLWSIDGASNARLVTNVEPGFSSIALSNKLFFFGWENQHGGEPWITDGTSAGTLFLKDCQPGIYSSGPERDGAAIAFHNNVFFRADQEDGVQVLWKTDGTPEGTTKARTPAGDLLFGAFYFQIFDGLLYFSATTTSMESLDIWQSDGTDHGTRAFLPKTSYTLMNNVAYFVASNAVVGAELWKMVATPPPQLRQISSSAAGIAFAITARAHSDAVVEVSRDLQTWRPFQTNSVPDTGEYLFTAEYTDEAQFYRVRTAVSP